MIIASLALMFLNIYSASNTRELMFQAKYASVQDKIQVVASSFETADTLSTETVDQVISVLGDINVSRLLITDAEGKVLYDSSINQNAVGKYALLEAVAQALGGNDVFHCTYHAGALQSYAAVPIMSRANPIGCVYVMDFDAEQGEIIENLERNILRGSWILLGGMVLCSAVFSVVSSKRMRKILLSMRLVREGEYSHKIQMRGDDEYTTLATEFNKLTDRLQESEATQRQFVSDASHELKTPLASIKLLSDSILQNDMDADTMREFVSDIGNESDRLTRMTQKLLTLSKADAETVCDHEVVDLSEIVRRVFRMLVPLADKTEVRLTANLDRGCFVLSMEDDAYQIIFNLVENGIKYNHSGGCVHVTVSHTQEDVELLVEDTGMGIPQAAIEHIFERFYRVDKARSRQAGGSGLGLSIVHELVERNFGSIAVSSEEGKGTRFTVRLPYFALEEDEDDA